MLKKKRQKEQRFRDIWNSIKWPDMSVTEVPEKGNQEQKKYLKKRGETNILL